MKYLFLSDLHLGSPLFKHTQEILKLININHYYDRIYLIGDIIDVWEDSIEDIIKDNLNLINAFNELDNLVIIKGNHDPKINELKDIFPKATVKESDILFIGNERVLLLHGHEIDDTITSCSCLARLVFPIFWIFERFGLNIKGFFRSLLHSVSAKIQNKNYDDLVLSIEKKIVSKYKDEYDIILAGHTHQPKIVKGNGYIYINCGDWIYNKTYVLYDNGEFYLKGEINE